MDSKLVLNVMQEEKSGRDMRVLALMVTVVYRASMPCGIRADKLAEDFQFESRLLEKYQNIPHTAGKRVGSRKAIISLDTLLTDPSAGIPLHQLLQEVGGGISRWLWIGPWEAEPGKLIDGSVLPGIAVRLPRLAGRGPYAPISEVSSEVDI